MFDRINPINKGFLSIDLTSQWDRALVTQSGFRPQPQSCQCYLRWPAVLRYPNSRVSQICSRRANAQLETINREALPRTYAWPVRGCGSFVTDGLVEQDPISVLYCM